MSKPSSGNGRVQPAGYTPKPTVSFFISALCGYCGSAGHTFPVAQQTGRQGKGAHQIMGEGMQQEDAADFGGAAHPQPGQTALARLGVE